VKIDVFKKEIALLGTEELTEKLGQMRKELFSLRLNSSVTHLKDYSSFSKLRGNIARVLTLVRQRESANKDNS
jgi:large subunit ribosomal protein L29